MRWKILTIGKPKLAYARAAVDEYLPRFRAPLQVEPIRPRSGESESTALLRHSENAFRVILDETGRQFASRDLAQQIAEWELLPHKEVCFLIGGASGHEPALLQTADARWSLGLLTLQHELALVVVLEQLYRAWSIRSGSPYHRE